MAGITVPVARRQSYALTVMPTFVSSTVMAQLVDTLAWTRGILMVRVYAKSMVASSSLTVVVTPVHVDDDDPAHIVAATTGLTSLSINANDAVPIVYQSALDAPITRYLRVELKASTGGGQFGQTTVDCSVDLVGRSA
jgi:hypothetical protein